MRSPVKVLFEHTSLQGWLLRNRNLILLRRRLKNQLPAKYRHGFYKTWILSHLVASRRQRNMSPDALIPLTVKISPSMRCNLQCIGCFAGNYPVENDMPYETMNAIVQEASALGIPSIGIIGGEPLLVPDIFRIFDEHRNVGFYIATNGTQVNAQVVKRLQGLPHVLMVFSVDGFRETNDKFRGRGVFQKVTASMGLMREAGLAFGFSTVVHRGNRDEVVSEKYVDFMIDQGCIFGGFLPYIPVGSTPQYDLVCSESEVDEYYGRLDKIGAHRGLLILKEGYSDGTFLNGGCGAGNTIHFTEKGEAEPCNGIQFVTDNIHQSHMTDIFTSPYFQDIRKLHPERRRECLVVAQPENILRIVEKHHASETHAEALKHLQGFISFPKTVQRNTDPSEGATS